MLQKIQKPSAIMYFGANKADFINGVEVSAMQFITGTGVLQKVSKHFREYFSVSYCNLAVILAFNCSINFVK